MWLKTGNSENWEPPQIKQMWGGSFNLHVVSVDMVLGERDPHGPSGLILIAPNCYESRLLSNEYAHVTRIK